MLKIRDLIRQWDADSGAQPVAHTLTLKLPLDDAARVLALADMYPSKTESELIAELLSSALDELEASLPYVPGERIVASDDHDDPIYEDIGPTPRFHDLTQKHRRRLEQRLRDAGSRDDD